MPTQHDHEDREEREMQADRAWRIDKHIPVPLIISLVILSVSNLAAGAWVASNFATRLNFVEQQYVLLAPLAGTLIEVKTTLNNLKDDVKDIKATLRQSSSTQH